ncbi:hypothetical protein ACOSP7_001492 [Xanthoceras sorbifolium]
MRYWNQVLLVKMGWRLFQRDGSMWSNLIYNKYVKNKNIADICNKNPTKCSSTWRGIAHGIKLLSVNFWTDRWVLGIDTLNDYALCPLDHSTITEKVSSFNDNGSWYVSRLRAVVPWDIIQRIISIQANEIGEGEDCLIWGNGSEGSFTVKSAYNSFFKVNLSDHWKFDFVWKAKIPPKIQCFLWLVAHGKIITNVQRSIFDADFRLYPWPHIPIFGAVQDWLVVAENKSKFTARLVNRSALWCPPPQNWVKLNVDRSRNSLGRIATSGAIRDSNGYVLDSEVWEMVEGFLYAWQARYKFLLVETDCFTVFEVLGQETKECHPLFNLL